MVAEDQKEREGGGKEWGIGRRKRRSSGRKPNKKYKKKIKGSVCP